MPPGQMITAHPPTGFLNDRLDRLPAVFYVAG